MQTVSDRRGERAGSDFRTLYRKLERTLGNIERSESNAAMLGSILSSLVEGFRDDLGFRMGRIYERDGSDFVLCCAHGGPHQVPIGFRVPPDYPPHKRTLDEGLVIMRKGEPGFDERIEHAIGVDSTFAAIAIGDGNTHVMAFSVDGEIKEERILYSLAAVRHMVNLKLHHQKLTGMIEEARVIQESLMPSSDPAFAGFSIHGVSRPAEIVGGDLFDFLPLSDRLLGIAIGDATGHGLPAALLARDVVTALRVIMDENLKLIRVVERLNSVVHRSALASKFISLFYAELDPAGALVYCNAGHNPPMLCRGRTYQELDRGGLILGPNPNARYDKGYAQLESGDVLVLYTDGLVEWENGQGEAFGTDRLFLAVQAAGGGGNDADPPPPPADARAIATAILESAERHANGHPHPDDITIVVVRRA